MNKQWNKDGLTRKKLENDFRIHEPFQVLEKNLSNLLARAFSCLLYTSDAADEL